jgi:transcriptional regulator with XRE-family HTH domain
MIKVNDYPTLTKLAERLRWARTVMHDYTQKEVAARSGVSRDVIAKLECGQIKQTRYIVQIADALHVPPSWLQFGEERFDHLSKEAIQWAGQYDRLTPRQRAIICDLVSEYVEINQVHKRT